MLWHIVLANNSITLTNNSRISFVRHGVVLVLVIYNIYIIYIIIKSLSRFYYTNITQAFLIQVNFMK
jgi:hypothetical protein